jgi:hypothetical protein
LSETEKHQINYEFLMWSKIDVTVLDWW